MRKGLCFNLKLTFKFKLCAFKVCKHQPQSLAIAGYVYKAPIEFFLHHIAGAYL